MRKYIIYAAALCIVLAWLKFRTRAGFTTDDNWIVTITSPAGEYKGGMRMWKFRDELTTCFVLVMQSGPQAWMPSVSCSVLFP